jgi:hypothetical protein
MLFMGGKSWLLGTVVVAGCLASLGEGANADPPRGRVPNRGWVGPRNGVVPGNVGRGFVPNNQFRYRYGYGYGYNPYWGGYTYNQWGPYYGVPYYGVPYYGYPSYGYPQSVPGVGVGVGGWPVGPSFGGGGFPSGPSFGGGGGSYRGGR